jgi:hypothetical protein
MSHFFSFSTSLVHWRRSVGVRQVPGPPQVSRRQDRRGRVAPRAHRPRRVRAGRLRGVPRVDGEAGAPGAGAGGGAAGQVPGAGGEAERRQGALRRERGAGRAIRVQAPGQHGVRRAVQGARQQGTDFDRSLLILDSYRCSI